MTIEMLRGIVLEELAKADIFKVLGQLINSAKLALELKDEKVCKAELTILQEYIQTIQDMTTILEIYEQERGKQDSASSVLIAENNHNII